MKIVKRRERVVVTTHYLEFSYENDPGAGFTFRCDQSGQIIGETSPAREANLRMCLSGRDGDAVIIPDGVRTYHNAYHTPAVGQCECGAPVELEGFTNECPECPRMYNAQGQRLADVDGWGEETGETPAEILSIR